MSANPLILIICLVALIGCDVDKTAQAKVQALPSATNLPAPALAASEKPVILLYQDSYSGHPQEPREQVIAVWSDGRIVWQANGALLQSRIDTKKIDALFQRLHREGVFGDGNAYYGNTGPDSSFDVIEVRLADRQLRMDSWHEDFEKNPKLVVTSRGVESLEGRNRDAVLAAEPPEYRRFRRVWLDIQSAVDSWIPSGGDPFTGTIPVGRAG